MQQIESDLRISQQHAKQEKKQGETSPQSDIKKESAATKWLVINLINIMVYNI